MVELQKTFSFDEHILPHLLREREKYSGRLAETGYGILKELKYINTRQQSTVRPPNLHLIIYTISSCRVSIFNTVYYRYRSREKRASSSYSWTGERSCHHFIMERLRAQ